MATARTLRECEDYKYFIILPDEPFIIFWNAWMLIVTCTFYIFNPYRLAFEDWDDPAWITIDIIWDIFFLIDIVLTFFKAFYTREFVLNDNRKSIAKDYISGWFIFDVLSILPLYFPLESRDYLSLIRHLRIITLPSLMKFNRFLKLFKRKFKFIRLFCRNISFSVEIERLIGLIVTFFLGCHLIACIWILIAEIGEDGFQSWIESYDLQTRSNFQLYMISYYFVITTFSTVGYGDFSPQTSYERIFVIFLEIGGIISFSFAIGSLTTIIEKFNSYDESLAEKLDTLEGIKRECDLGPGIYDLSRQYLVFQENADTSQAIDLISKLPMKLRIEISSMVLKARIAGIKFFKGKSKEFLSFISQLITPAYTQRDLYIFREGEKARFIYFLINGKAGYALEFETPCIYVSIGQGEMFGNTDMLRTSLDKMGDIKRKFTVIAIEDCETARLSLEHLSSIKEQFPQIYEDIFKNSGIIFRRINALKRRTIQDVLNKNADQQIINKSGVLIPIKEYQTKADENDAIENVIDINHLENLEFSDLPSESESEEEDNDRPDKLNTSKQASNMLLGKLVGKKKTDASSNKIKTLENKMNQLDKKFESLRVSIKSDMRMMLEHYLGKSKNPEDIEPSED